MAASETTVRERLQAGTVIPAHPLALTERRTLDERHQRALTRYYMDAGAGGIAVGVHTTQFAIRQHGLYAPVLELAAQTASSWFSTGPRCVLIAGVIGKTAHAVDEARIAHDLGYDMILLSLGALQGADDDQLLSHCRTVAEVLPLFGFYLQPAVGGRVLSRAFWRRFAEIENAWAVKIAPFNRYQTLDVVQAVAESGRDDLALYTGNDDSIVTDLLTPYPVPDGSSRRIVGGLLGQWAVWTRRAVDLLERVKRDTGAPALTWLREGAAITDANGALFDAAHEFAGCIPGVHEVLRRQGLMRGIWCLDPAETLSPGQTEEIDRVCRQYPELADDPFVRENLDRWLA